ncbi:two-component regulator propeller domain-containing protein [Cytophagaceae bacterium ABcell3]|nr:two-component regulator propeller domain-containing protein [Cytophagaceae bacterium ABcell3]
MKSIRSVIVPLAFICMCLPFGYAQSCFDLHEVGASSGNYTCLSVDEQNRIWLGTDKSGLYSYDGNNWSRSAFLGEHHIMQIVPDSEGGVWIAQRGTDFSSSGGGVSYISPNGSDEKKYFFSFANNDREGYGLPSPRMQSVAIDGIGRVWAAGTYSHLYVQGVGTYFNPGGVSILDPGADRFSEIRPTTQYSSVGLLDAERGLNVTPLMGSGCVRNCEVLAPGPGKMYLGWKGMNDCFLHSRIRAFNIPGGGAGLKMGAVHSFNENNTPFDLSVAVSAEAMTVDRNGNIWVGLRFGHGFGVYEYFHELNKPNTWHYVLDASADASVNWHAISASENSDLVAIGTTKGLYVYQGQGDLGDLDNYYYFNTENSNIPSDNVTGVAFDKDDKLWIATDEGVASVKFGGLEMYSLKIDYRFYNPLLYTTSAFSTDSLRYRVGKFGRFACDVADDMAEVAADGSNLTMFVWRGGNAENVSMRIKENVLGNDDEYGYFRKIMENDVSDSAKFRYYHPKFLPSIYTLPNTEGRRFFTVELYDETSDEVLYSERIRVVLPPVLMLHGIFSEKSRTRNMADFLIETGQYKDFMVRSGGFDEMFIGFPSSSMAYQLRDEIDDMKRICAEKGVSFGKVDVLGHSTGGLGVRYYIQKMYREDINKFIAIHVPNSGSQYIDLLSDERIIDVPIFTGAGVRTANSRLGEFIMYPTFKDEVFPKHEKYKKFVPFSGGTALSYYHDRTLPIPPTNINLHYEQELKTTSGFLHELNSPAGLQAEREKGVPTHVIADPFVYGISEAEMDLIMLTPVGGAVQSVAAVLKAATGIKGIILRTTVAKKAGDASESVATDFILWVADRLGIEKGLADYFLERLIFKDANDGVVAVESQIGGMDTLAVSYDTSYSVAHESFTSIKEVEGSYDHLETQLNVFGLLGKKSDAEMFSTSGFNPPRLEYSFCESCPFLSGSARMANSHDIEDLPTVVFEGPSEEVVYYPGDSVEFDIVKDQYEGAVTLISLYGENIDLLDGIITEATEKVKFKVPDNAYGKLLLTAEVFDTVNAAIVLDTISFEVQLKPGVEIDSVKIHTGDNPELFIMKDTSLTCYVDAFYNDGSHRVIRLDSSFQSSSTLDYFSVESSGQLTGVVEGLDMLRVSYNGSADSVYVNIVPKFTMPERIEEVIIEDPLKAESKALVGEWLSVYPNPADNVLNLRFDDNNPAVSVKLLDVSGRLVYMDNATRDHVNLNISSLKNGLYLLIVNNMNTGEVHHKRVVVQK